MNEDDCHSFLDASDPAVFQTYFTLFLYFGIGSKYVEEKLIELYCTICQCNDSRYIEGKQRLNNNNCPEFSDGELITVYPWGKAQQLLTRKAIYQHTKIYLLEWFPKIPSYQAFCRRLNRLAPAFRALAEIWTEQTVATAEDTHQYAVDSCPIMAARRSYSTGARVGREFCDKSYNSSRNEWYYGVKLHAFVMLRSGRLPLLRAAWINPPSVAGLSAAKQMDLDFHPLTNGTLFADKAYCDAGWADSLDSSCKINLLTPRKNKPYDTLSSGDCYSTSISALRQPIESFFHWAEFHAHIQCASFARSLHGLWSHIFASLALLAFLLGSTIDSHLKWIILDILISAGESWERDLDDMRVYFMQRQAALELKIQKLERKD